MGGKQNTPRSAPFFFPNRQIELGDLIDARETASVLVGHGSCDARAITETLQFTEILRVAHSNVIAFPCFSTMASPSMDETLHRMVELPVRRVVIQPHLHFSGRLASRIHTTVTEIGQVARSTQEWIIIEPLGPDRRLAEVVVELVSRGLFL